MKKTNKQTQPAYRPIPVVSADVNVGLRMQEVVLRSKNGLRNVTPASNTRSEKQIIKENVFTFFNLIFIVLAAARSRI